MSGATPTDEELVERLQRMVDTFVADVEAVQAGLADGRTPEAARRALTAALIYVVERFDLVPDHIEGLGITDDAAVLRLAAKTAVSYGADDPETRRLAGEAAELTAIFGDLIGPLEDYLNRLQWGSAHIGPWGDKTPAEVLADPDSRVQLWRDVGMKLDQYQPHPLVGKHGDASNVLRVLRLLVKARLEKAGLIG